MRRLLTLVDQHRELTPEKARLIHTIFRLLSAHKGSDVDLLKYKNFGVACQDKLRCFYYHFGFDGAAGYYSRLFDASITP